MFEYTKLALKGVLDLEPNIIPIGTIDFVTKVLNKLYLEFKLEQPIEIPKYLQTDEFLKRLYKIGTWKDII